jgi:hypothetical protein
MQSDEKSSLSEQLLLGEVNYDAEGMEALPMALLAEILQKRTYVRA